ncbi:ABC transporter multidrug efflux pump, fused ATP-binding domain protein [Rhodopirellula islandica]|uniref:ABC transporter multidrug efflux pump, fused ATP-binding domain protein n=1 Tax=Rhodopirellula islandica TaxID=595434 RepID=A0A0J1BJQ5_RHOIS|nr:ATP-binding cassette domain-containing protein [Rhodopirellula islandica]KLU06790.1 ABC transporter multidrug efflux pump, fused ATP-binding domain protein [Rhodopirellula islandica]
MSSEGLVVSSPNRGEVALHLNDVTKNFQAGKRTVTALRDLQFSVATGKITGLIGPDGAGKTTVMRLATGILQADRGTVTVLGLDAARQSLQVQATVGYMPQRFGLYEDLTVQENLDLYADLQGVPLDVRPTRFTELMHMTGLAPFTNRLAGKLSGGMKQKLGLACTLIHPPQLLLLDEPTVGVDPVSRRELWTIVERFVREEGTTVLLSTAYLDEAERCDEVIMLDEGQLLGQGPPTQFSEPLTGRAFQVQIPGRKNRDVQEQLAGQAGVTDAVIQGDSVRLIVEGNVDASVEKWFPNDPNASITAVPPRFEDGFIAMLHERRERSSAVEVPSKRPPLILLDPSGEKSKANVPEPLIKVQEVERQFGDFYAVKRVTFDVAPGEVFGLLGANGAGKTTLFRMLCGLLPATGGTLQVAGVDVRKAAATARAKIGYMSQKFSLYGTLSVADNLRFFSSAYGLRGSRRRERMEWATHEFELQAIADDNSGGLPLGYKQRLSLACALMHEPEILFLDEPTSGVDPLTRREFWHRINSLAASGVTVLVTTHFMEEAEYCDRMAIMMSGEILALGTPAEIKHQSANQSNPNPTMEEAFIQLIESPMSEISLGTAAAGSRS